MQRNLTVAQAQDTILEEVSTLAAETVPVADAQDRILAEEEACLAQYGDSYRDYMRRVPRYLVFF